MRPTRLITLAAVLVALVPGTAGPAAAAARPTHVAEAVDQATVHVGSPLRVSGATTPVRAGATVTLQRYDGKAWRALARQKSGAAGTFAFTVKAPRTAGAWLLRVVRGATGATKVGVGATLHVRVVKKAFGVTGKATLGSAYGSVVVSGVVTPPTPGRILVQRLVGRSWTTVTRPTLTRASTYAATLSLPTAGAYALRVVKPFSTTTAQGISRTLHVTIPVPDPVVTTTTLPRAVVARAYSVTLSATQGVGPYTWSVAGLPTGLAASPAGVISGATTLPGVFPLAAAVTDARGRTGVTMLSLTVAQTHVMSWGYNASGELGNGTTTDTTSAALEPGIDGITAVASTVATVMLLRDDGTVWCQGYTSGGACGLGPLTDASTPQQVPGMTDVVAVAAGSANTYVLRSDGTVWATGPNAAGQLGNGTTTPTRVFQQVLGLGRAVAIAGGNETAYALLADGTVWAWGRDADGELGQGSLVPDSAVPLQVKGIAGVTAISATYYNGIALLADGTVRTWGGGSQGVLGNGSLTNSPTPVAVTGLTGVRSLSANVTVYAAYAVRADGTVWAWGDNSRGQLGDGTTTNRATPVRVLGLTNVVQVSGGSTNVFAVLADGTLDGWGEGSSGGLGDGDHTGHFRTSPAPVAGVADALAVAGGEAFAVAVVAG